MEAIREVTKWEGGLQCNHVYLMDGDKAVAYQIEGKGEPVYFKSGYRIDKRGRKFVKADLSIFKHVESKSNIVRVDGSKGNVYEVDLDAGTCTCQSFQFRGKCKHIAIAQGMTR